jgi:hypothetical protein
MYYDPYGYLPQGILGFSDIYANMRQPQMTGPSLMQPQPQMMQSFSSPQMLKPNLAPVQMEGYGMTISDDAKAKGKDFIKDLFAKGEPGAGTFDAKENYIQPQDGYRANEAAPAANNTMRMGGVDTSMYNQALNYIEQEKERKRLQYGY